MPLAYLSIKNTHGSHMCCEVGKRDMDVFARNGVEANDVEHARCAHVDHVSHLLDFLPVEKRTSICSDFDLSHQTRRALCDSTPSKTAPEAGTRRQSSLV